MSNYSKTTDFASKDALTTGNANKIVKGTEIDDEFNAIQVAIATKANTISPTLTGTPLAPTAAADTNTTQIATTAFVTAALAVAETARQALYPVGTIYTQASVATNPATLLGFGTWEEFGAGKVIIGVDTSNTLFDTLGETGGAADITISDETDSHTLTIDEIPAHTHGVPNAGSNGTDGIESADKNNNPFDPVDTNSTGGGQGHTHGITYDGTNANYQPYITVYMWKRTA